jgi:hypothetical protein
MFAISPFAVMAMQIGGAATSAIGAYGTASANRIAMRSQANIAEINARISEQAAQGELLKGEREEQRTRLNTAQLKSRQRAVMAASGVDLGSDSATNILTGTDVMGEIDANTVAANAVRSAWGYRTQASNYTTDAIVKRGAAKGMSPTTAMASSLMGSAGSVAQSWYAMGKNAPSKSKE